MCRPLYYLLLQPCASDAQTAAAKWVIQPWGSPALPLSLYPLFPSPPLYLFLSYPPPFSPCHSIPRLLSPLSPLIFLVTCCFSLIDRIPQYESLCICLFVSLPQNFTTFSLFSSSVLFSHFIILAVSIIFCHLFSIFIRSIKMYV